MAARLIRVALAASLAGVGVVAGPAAPAAACTCATLSDSEQFDAAAMVFVGAVSGTERRWFGRTVAWQLDVEAVQKGDVAERQIVLAEPDGPSCGYTFRQGRRYQIFARLDDGSARTDRCSGTREASTAFGPLGSSPRVAGAGRGFNWMLAGDIAMGAVALFALVFGPPLWRRHRRTRRP